MMTVESSYCNYLLSVLQFVMKNMARKERLFWAMMQNFIWKCRKKNEDMSRC